jgi:hypothetical protein
VLGTCRGLPVVAGKPTPRPLGDAPQVNRTYCASPALKNAAPGRAAAAISPPRMGPWHELRREIKALCDEGIESLVAW